MSPERLTEQGAGLARKLLTETREDLARADNKAQILFAAAGLAISVVIGGVLAGDWRPHDLSCVAEAIWWIGAGASAIGVASLVCSLWPRVGRSRVGRVRYFADVRRYDTCDELIPHLNAEAARETRDAEQALLLASIIWTKYLAIMVAIVALSIGGTAAVVAVVIG